MARRERLWRSVKYENVYLKADDGVGATRQSLAPYLEFYDARRQQELRDGSAPSGAGSVRFARVDLP